jgi:tRNA U34 5-methylaminomethyl-2-thiouridine-forming methyltransferase MnmC
MEIKIIESGDGSHTLFLPHLNETYHSHHGALRESQYVFIEKGLDEFIGKKEEITILEVGFGTGLNALLTMIWASEKKIKVNYHTLEPFPLTIEIYEKLNYLSLLHREELTDPFFKMHQLKEQVTYQFNDWFCFTKYYQKLEEFNRSLKVDLIYYDAFAPNKQPEVWDLKNIKKTFSLLSQQGLLVSYCASGQFKRNLKEAGYIVETLSGPPGKKEMTRGFIQK